MGHTQRTEREEKERKVKAILAVKFGTVEPGSLAYWEALADAETVTV
jgi:hypothetical protein